MPAIHELATPGAQTFRGKALQLIPVDGYGMQLFKQADESNKMEMFRASCEIVARCTGYPFDEVFGTKDRVGFSEKEVGFLLNEILKQVTAVEASAPPNSEAAAERTEPNISRAG